MNVSNRNKVALLERLLPIYDLPVFAHKKVHELLFDFTKVEFGNPVESEAHLGPFPVFDFTTSKDERRSDRKLLEESWTVTLMKSKSASGHSTASPIHPSLHYDIDYATQPSLIRPLLIVLSLEDLRVAKILDFKFRDFGRPVGIQSETSSIPIAEFNSALTLKELGVRSGSIIHFYWNARGDGVQYGNFGSTITGTGSDSLNQSALSLASDNSTLVNLNWAFVSFPATVASSVDIQRQLNPNTTNSFKTSTATKKEHMSTVSISAKSYELMPPIVEIMNLEEHFERGRIMTKHAMDKPAEKLTLLITPTDTQRDPFEIVVLPGFSIDTVKDIIYFKSPAYLPQGIFLFTKDICEEYTSFNQADKTVDDYKLAANTKLQLSYTKPKLDKNVASLLPATTATALTPSSGAKDHKQIKSAEVKPNNATSKAAVENQNATYNDPENDPVAYSVGIHAPVINLALASGTSNAPAQHVEFTEDTKPTMIISEPVEFFVPQSHQLSYFDPKAHSWTSGATFTSADDGKSAMAKIDHFSNLGIKNVRHFGIFKLDELAMDPQFDYDFTDVDDTGRTFQRGGMEYKRPIGMKRYATKVGGVYDNDEWLGIDGKSWPVAYHGTGLGAAMNIAKGGFKNPVKNGTQTAATADLPTSRCGQLGSTSGMSIYLSKDYKYALNYASWSSFIHEGVTYVVRTILQSRVRPGSYKVQTVKNAYQNEREWLFEDPNDIRVYGVCMDITASP